MSPDFNQYLEEHWENEFEISQQEFGCDYVGKVDDDILHQMIHDHTYLIILTKYTFIKYK